MLTRLSGGAQQPLSNNLGMEGRDCCKFCRIIFNIDPPISILAVADLWRFFAKKIMFLPHKRFWILHRFANAAFLSKQYKGISSSRYAS